MAAPFAEREVAEPPTHVPFGRRIVRSDGNAQKSMTAPENGRRPNVEKGANLAVSGGRTNDSSVAVSGSPLARSRASTVHQEGSSARHRSSQRGRALLARK